MYKLETENFSLELLPGICQDSFPYPKANSLRVKVSSLGFSADSIMDIDDIALSDFAVNLNELYETLSGSVRLEEPYSMPLLFRIYGCDRRTYSHQRPGS